MEDDVKTGVAEFFGGVGDVGLVEVEVGLNDILSIGRFYDFKIYCIHHQRISDIRCLRNLTQN